MEDDVVVVVVIIGLGTLLHVTHGSFKKQQRHMITVTKKKTFLPCGLVIKRWFKVWPSFPAILERSSKCTLDHLWRGILLFFLKSLKSGIYDALKQLQTHLNQWTRSSTASFIHLRSWKWIKTCSEKQREALCPTWCTASSSFCCVSSISFSTSLNISLKVNWPRATWATRVSPRSKGLFWSAFTRLIERDMRVKSSIAVVEQRDSSSLTSGPIEGKLTKGREKKTLLAF